MTGTKLPSLSTVDAVDVYGENVKIPSESATLWELVNAVTGYVQHDKKRKGKPDAADRALIALGDNETAAAWKLAFALSS